MVWQVLYNSQKNQQKKSMLQGICALKIEMIQFTYTMDDQKMNLLLSNVVMMKP